MALHIPDIRAIRLFVSFVIPYANFITNFTNVTNATNFNRLFSGKPLAMQMAVRSIAHILKERMLTQTVKSPRLVH